MMSMIKKSLRESAGCGIVEASAQSNTEGGKTGGGAMVSDDHRRDRHTPCPWMRKK